MEFSRPYLIIVIIGLLCALYAAKSANEYLDVCIDSKNHKSTPGHEGKDFVGSCKPWSNHSCCTTNTSAKIEADGILSLYNMLLDQCPSIKSMSAKCSQHFKRDTCFYECSPNLGPWVVKDDVSKVTRKERAMHIPLCADDCDQWFHDCKDDYTCSDNWGDSSNWNWKKKGTVGMCTKPCKTFSQYYRNPKTFCEKIFNYSYKYGSNNRSTCMQLWPKSWKDNLDVTEMYAKIRAAETRGSAYATLPSWLQTVALVFLGTIFL